MSEEKKGFKFFDKLKKVKHIEIYIAVIFIVIILLIYLSNFSKDKPESQSNKLNDSSITAYIDNMETNLESILSNIGGVSNVKVMITLDMTKAEVADSKITLNSFPPIKGVIVTAKGLSNTAAKLKVLQAVEAVLDITSGNIEILSSD